MFLAVLFITAEEWKQPKSPLTDEGINKMWINKMKEYYLALKSNEILIYVTTWISLETLC